MKTKTLIMMVGLPRSGKTTKVEEFMGAPVVNPDAIRLAIHGKPFIGPAEPFVWATAHAMVDALFLAGHDRVIMDACNNTRKRRDEWRYGQWERRVFEEVDTPVEVCLKRNTDENMVSVIKRMAEQHEPVEEDER